LGLLGASFALPEEDESPNDPNNKSSGVAMYLPVFGLLSANCF
jgi:hypothetical protein